jgi:hypothetical protein
LPPHPVTVSSVFQPTIARVIHARARSVSPADDGGQAMMEAIQKLADINNQFYPGSALSFSMGAATSQPGERLEAVAKRADLTMFEQKRAHYSQAMQARRARQASSAA